VVNVPQKNELKKAAELNKKVPTFTAGTFISLTE